MSALHEQYAQLDQLRHRLDEVRATAADGVAPADREALKQALIALFRQAQVAVADAQALKEAVRSLVEEWKTLDDTRRPPQAEARAVPPVEASAPGTPAPRLDHLGAATFIEKGWSRLSLEDYHGAEAALRRALELVPAQNEAESLLAWALMLQGRHADALEAAHAVLARDPASAVAQVAVAYVAMQQARSGDAVEGFSRAIALDGDHKATLYAHLYLGMSYRRQGMADVAEEYFRRTLELGPNCLQAWYERGCNHWAEGRTDEAMRAWRAGSEANKFSPWGKRCAEVLTRVEQGDEPVGRDADDEAGASSHD